MNTTMKKAKKPTRRQIVRRLVYAHLRVFVRARLASGTAAYDSNEYRKAEWEERHYWGRCMGALDAVEALGVLTWSEHHRLERRCERVYDAARKRWQKLLDEKYARLRQERNHDC